VPLHVSNVQVVCPRCNRPTRIAHGRLEGEHGRSTRICKRCGEQIEVSSK
jgi:large subunit ribosomal protein L24